MRILFLATVSLFLVLVVGSRALAWDCSAGSPEESFRRASVVFEGEVVRVNRNKEDSSTTYTFSVSKMLKGPSVKEVTIFGTGSSCSATFVLNVAYRVYASEYKGKLMSGACSGNVVLKEKGEH